MSKQEFLIYLKEYLDELIEDSADKGLDINYQDCMNILLTEMTN